MSELAEGARLEIVCTAKTVPRVRIPFSAPIKALAYAGAFFHFRGDFMSDYIMWLRSFVGHAPILQCGAGVIVENSLGQILLIKRTDNSCWGYAGGAVEPGEKVEDAACRELFEETGLIADELELFSVFSGDDNRYTYPNGDEVHNIDIVYICKKFHGNIKADLCEASDVSFFDIDSLPENISPPLVVPINKYLEKRKEQPAD